jgi:hypothetical protein
MIIIESSKKEKYFGRVTWALAKTTGLIARFTTGRGGGN